MTVRTAYIGTATATVLTAANLNTAPGGWIGYAEVTANQATITAEVDLTSLTLAVTVGPSRRIRITAGLAFVCTVAGGLARVNIKEGATQLQQRSFTTGSTSAENLFFAVVITPTAGAHTYKLTGLLAVGSGSMSLAAAATSPGFILVEDIGPA